MSTIIFGKLNREDIALLYARVAERASREAVLEEQVQGLALFLQRVVLLSISPKDACSDFIKVFEQVRDQLEK